jgi:hypothetical protein
MERGEVSILILQQGSSCGLNFGSPIVLDTQEGPQWRSFFPGS